MRTMILTLVMLFFATGCNEEKANEQQKNSIYGTWQLIERYHLLPSSVQIIENGEVIIFNIDGDFFGKSYPCKGVYESLDDDVIEVSFQCRDKILFYQTQESDILELRKPFGWEGGYDRYEKIASDDAFSQTDG